MTKVQKPIQEAAEEIASSTVSVATAAEAGFPEAPRDQEEEQADELPASLDLALYAQHMAALSTDLFNAAFDVMLEEAHRRGLITAPEQEPAEPEHAEEAQPEDEHAPIRELLRRHGLLQAWQDAAGNYHFDPEAAEKAKASTVILPVCEAR